MTQCDTCHFWFHALAVDPMKGLTPPAAWCVLHPPPAPPDCSQYWPGRKMRADIWAELELLEARELRGSSWDKPVLYGPPPITTGEDWREFAHRVVELLCPAETEVPNGGYFPED